MIQANCNLFSTLAVCASLAVTVAGCNRKADANHELEQAARTFEKAEPAQPAPPVLSEPVPSAPPVAAPAPAQELKQAMVAYKAGNLEDAVTRLQKLRATPVMAPEKRMALQDAIAAVMTEIHALADKGDARAQQAIKRYEQMQTSH